MWVTDHYNNKNVYELLALLAYETETIKIGSGVSNPFLRNNAIIASAATTLDEISEGRAILGIGPGDKATMEKLGVIWNKPATTVKNAIVDINTLINGNCTDSGALLTGTSKIQDHIPIYMGAQGPVMLRSSGEVADGALINASNYKDFEVAIPLIKKGLDNNNRSINNFDIGAYTACSINSNIEKAYNAARIVVAFIIAGSPEVVLNRHDINLKEANIIKEYLKNQEFKKSSNNITPKMLNAFSVCGTPKDITEKIEKLDEIGVTQFVAGSPIGKDKEESLRLLADVIKSY